MKVGDWVRYKSFNYISIVTKIYDDKKGYYSKFSVEVRDWNRNNTKTAKPEQLELWQPKEGEYCWFYDKDCKPILCKSNGIVIKYNDGTICYMSDEYIYPGTFGTNYCEPSICELPSFIKG